MWPYLQIYTFHGNRTIFIWPLSHPTGEFFFFWIRAYSHLFLMHCSAPCSYGISSFFNDLNNWNRFNLKASRWMKFVWWSRAWLFDQKDVGSRLATPNIINTHTVTQTQWHRHSPNIQTHIHITSLCTICTTVNRPYKSIHVVPSLLVTWLYQAGSHQEFICADDYCIKIIRDMPHKLLLRLLTSKVANSIAKNILQ